MNTTTEPMYTLARRAAEVPDCCERLLMTENGVLAATEAAHDEALRTATANLHYAWNWAGLEPKWPCGSVGCGINMDFTDDGFLHLTARSHGAILATGTAKVNAAVFIPT